MFPYEYKNLDVEICAILFMTRIEKDAEIAKLNIDPTEEEDRVELPKLAQALLGDPFKRLFTGIEKIHETINFDVED